MFARTFAAALLLGFATAMPAAGQSWAVDRGSLRLGGTASFTSSGSSFDGVDGDDRTTQLGISPSIEYFFVPGLAIGGTLSVGYLSSGDDDDATSFGIGPSITWFFGGSEPKSTWPFIGAQLLYSRTSFGDDDDDLTGFGYQADGGLMFMVSNAVGIEAALFYRRLEQENGPFELDVDTFGLQVGVSAFVF